jgi:catechol 2,3-dioxygenase-like lactoylglutathione lyase family enzyme
MLDGASVQVFLLATERERTRVFFEDVLELRFLAEDEFALTFEAGGAVLRVALVESFTPQIGTALGWRVPDVAAAVRDLAGRGIRFERFPGMEQDDLGIWTPPGGGGVAWFTDPDGNTLSVSGLT